jgi:hypothetical protein
MGWVREDGGMADDDALRQHLDELGAELETYHGSGRDHAIELLEQLRATVGAAEPHESGHADLRERLEVAAVDFEVDHPGITAALRRAADALAATGL